LQHFHLPKLISKSILFILILLIIIGSYFYVLYLPWKPHWLDGQTFWYQLYWKGDKVGFVQVSYDFQQDGNFQVNQLTSVKTINRGEKLELNEREILTFDSNNGELITTFYKRQQGDYQEHTQLDLINGNLVGDRYLNQQITSVNLKQDGYNLNEYLRLMHWPSEKPQLNDTLITRRLDFGELSLNKTTYQVLEINPTTDELLIGFHEKNRSWNGTIELSSSGTPKRYAVERLVEQRLSTKEQALEAYIPSDYYFSQIIRLDKPLGDVHKLKSIHLSSLKLSEFGIVDDQRQFIDSNNLLQINRKNAFKDVLNHDELTYLQQPYNKELVLLSKKVVGKSDETVDKIAKLLEFVSNYLIDAPVTHPMTISTILQQRKGDCTEHTRLFIAMARALEIPARKIEGLVYLGDEIQGFGGHVWSEVVIGDHWVAVDPTWNLQQLSATHIQLDNNNKDELFNKMHKNSALSFRLEKIDNEG